VHDLAGSSERCATWGIITKACTTQTFFILFIPLLAGFFVFF
jgi:hypothetical protein